MTDTLDYSYVYCNTRAAVLSAVSILSASTNLAFDCEGQSLGNKGGRLSLISLRNFQAGDSAQTYLIDTVALKGRNLRPIYDILESQSIRKIVFDGRKDYSSLLHDRHVEVTNVIDLQLADVKSRTFRRESSDKHFQRLSQIIPLWELRRNRMRYERIDKLSGMKACASEHLGMQFPKSNLKFDHDLWLQRPLSEDHLAHAIEDVVIIGQLYNLFEVSGFLYSQIVDDSQRYISLWKYNQPEPGDIYRNHSILVMDILDRQGGRKFACVSCQRMLPFSCFVYDNYVNGIEECLVCCVADEAHDRRARREAAQTTRGRGRGNTHGGQRSTGTLRGAGAGTPARGGGRGRVRGRGRGHGHA